MPAQRSRRSLVAGCALVGVAGVLLTPVTAGASVVAHAPVATPTAGVPQPGVGQVVAWGRNLFGQTNVPAGLRGVSAVAAGTYQSLAVRADGTVVEWGDS